MIDFRQLTAAGTLVIALAASSAASSTEEAAPAEPRATALDLTLDCRGVEHTARYETTRFSARASGEASEGFSGSTSKLEPVDVPRRLTLELRNGSGRIRLPREMMPMFGEKPGDGWYQLADLVVGEDEITARFETFGLTKPALRINRRTGEIIMSKGPHFKGDCVRASPERMF